MNDIFNSLGNFLFWIFAICIGVLAGVVWYAFEYWYIILGVTIVVCFLAILVPNDRKNEQIKGWEREEREKLKQLRMRRREENKWKKYLRN
ncbi:hypothetical protein ACI76W_04270 [Capnocytophaga canimorsus]|uniref:hypothetical protein n=1 Tax=Capnocytophaga canimorsus TaxID=28188 RepID=UPI0038585946